MVGFCRNDEAWEATVTAGCTINVVLEAKAEACKECPFLPQWITSQTVHESKASPQILNNCLLSVQFLLHCVTQYCDDGEIKVFTVCSVNNGSCCYLTFGKNAAFQYGLPISSLILHPNVTTTILLNWQQCRSFCSSAGEDSAIITTSTVALGNIQTLW